MAIRACPFCTGNRFELDGDEIDRQFWIRCRCCAAEGPWARTRFGAEDAWNQRPTPASAAEAGS